MAAWYQFKEQLKEETMGEPKPERISDAEDEK